MLVIVTWNPLLIPKAELRLEVSDLANTLISRVNNETPAIVVVAWIVKTDSPLVKDGLEVIVVGVRVGDVVCTR